VIDGNNVFGARPDGWWNDRRAAQLRLTQRVAEWCRGHDDHVTLVFDAPLDAEAARLAGGNLTVVEARHRGRDGADDEIVALIDGIVGTAGTAGIDERDDGGLTVVTSDRGLRARLPAGIDVIGVGRFRDRVGY
jgi:hypothetical protein